jgi:F-type H+/Na+-transporting ATPase subunit alpha
MNDVTQSLLQKIEQQLAGNSLMASFDQKGEIIEIKDGVALVGGLTQAMYSEIVIFDNGMRGLVLDLLQDYVGILVLWDYTILSQWDIVSCTGKLLSVGVGDQYIGRVVNGLWDPIDNGLPLETAHYVPVEKVAPWVITRKSVTVPLQTGIKAIDAMIPIGRGQRELIIGDRQTGKTSVAIDTILAQKGEWVVCIYVAIGQKESKVARTVEALREAWAMDYTIVVSAPINAPAVVQYIAPYVGCAFGEYFMDKGKDALIVYDDLSKHAVAYREVSLLLRRPPGREAYPGDIFYLHSRLLERSARLNEDFGGWSLTALPIIETQAWDVSAYIPTNVISITDGQIYLESTLFNAWVKPAINVWLSVSRVGWAAQTGVMKKIAGTLKLELAAFRELETFAKFGSDLDATTQAKLARGERMVELLKQKEHYPLHYGKQAVVLYAGINGYLDKIPLSKIRAFEQTIYEKLDTTFEYVMAVIKRERKLTDEIVEGINKLLEEAVEEYSS